MNTSMVTNETVRTKRTRRGALPKALVACLITVGSLGAFTAPASAWEGDQRSWDNGDQIMQIAEQNQHIVNQLLYHNIQAEQSMSPHRAAKSLSRR